jgi:hypothetical protein
MGCQHSMCDTHGKLCVINYQQKVYFLISLLPMALKFLNLRISILSAFRNIINLSSLFSQYFIKQVYKCVKYRTCYTVQWEHVCSTEKKLNSEGIMGNHLDTSRACRGQAYNGKNWWWWSDLQSKMHTRSHSVPKAGLKPTAKRINIEKSMPKIYDARKHKFTKWVKYERISYN